MKAWCGAVLLSLVSVCSAAPLTCDKLLAPVDQGPHLSGRWYLHALSTDSCVLSNLLHTFMKPSIAVDFTLKETQKQYEVTTTAKMLGFCMNDTDSYFYEKNSLVDSKYNRTEYGLLSSSCSDCTVVKVGKGSPISALFLYSRKSTIGAAELKEFETQAACLRLPSPQVFDTDYDFVNCKDMEDDDPNEEDLMILTQRLETFVAELIKCMVLYVSSWIKSYTA